MATMSPAATLRRVRCENCFSSLGRPQDGHEMLNPFFQPLYSTVLNEKSNNLLPTFSRCAAINYYTLYSAQEMGIYYCVTVPIDYYASVGQSIVNLLLHHSFTKNENLLLSTSLY